MINGTKCFDRSMLKTIFFGRGENDVWFLKTVRLDRDSLAISVIRSAITEDTMKVIVNLYLGIDPNATLVVRP